MGAALFAGLLAFAFGLAGLLPPEVLTPDMRIGAAVIGGLALLLVLWSLIRTTGRLNTLTRDLRAVAQGRSEHRASATLSGALGDVALAANDVASRLQRLDSDIEKGVIEHTRRLRDERDQLLGQNQKLRSLAAGAQAEAKDQSELLSSLSHELRTPLTGILGYADLLRRSGLNAEQAQQLETLEKSARALLAMINDLLDWSRIEAGRLRLNEDTFNVIETVEDTCALLAALAYDKNLELVPIVYHDVPRQVRGDAQRLRQILTNLLSNAIKFTERGEVVVRVMREREDGGRTWLRVSVSDTGIGMTPDQQARLFQPYRQVGHPRAQSGGSGLGLSITRKLCELMGGEIELTSTPGQGSTFSVLLPYKLLADAESAPMFDAQLSGQTVWLHESHATARLALVHWLEFWGLQVRGFERAEKLAEALRTVSPADKPALAILGLAPGDRGLKPFRDILAACAEHQPPLLVLVASVALPVLEDIQSAGAAACHPKSIGHRRLHEEIRRLTSAISGSDPHGLAGQRILIADNNLVNRRYLVALCRRLGMDPLEAGDGSTAVEVWRRERPPFVILDARMPGLEGPDCARAIRSAQANGTPCRIVGISAYLDPEERTTFRYAGADAILIKPFDESELLAQLEPEPARRQLPAAARLTDDPELLALLKDELPEQYRLLHDAFAARDLDAARDAAHTLRGTAAFYHLASLRQTTSSLEEWLQRATALQEGMQNRRELESVRRAVSDTLDAIQRS